MSASEPLCIRPPPWNNDYTPNPKCRACTALNAAPEGEGQ